MIVRISILSYLLSAVLVLSVGGRNSWAVELIKAEAALKNIFPEATNFEKKDVVLTEEQVRLIQESAGVSFEMTHSAKLIVYRIEASDKIIGYAFEDVVVGKWAPIHYLVGLDLQGTVLQVVVLEYKEIRGRPVAKKRFLNQYKGKTIQDELMLRSDIDGVTGATISSRSMTDGVRKILHIFKLIKDSFDETK